MSTPITPPGPIAVGENPVADDRAAVPKPNKTLPTERINVSKQLDILRAYAAVSNSGTKPAPVNEVASVMKMAASTVSLANAFLSNIGLIVRTDAGSYSPSAEVVSFLRAYEWDKETASYKLAPLLRDTWFSKALLSRLSFNSLEEEAAIAILAEASAAAPEYKKELRMILDFMVAGGLIRRDGSTIKLVTREAADGAGASTPVPKVEESNKPLESARSNPGNISTAFSASPAGAISFNVHVQVDMSEFGSWRPERIQAFFRGIAEVLAAKADVEKGGPAS
jgi:hypothetical protein